MPADCVTIGSQKLSKAISSVSLLPSIIQKISQTPSSSLASVHLISENVLNTFLTYEQGLPTTVMYVPSRFDGKSDIDIKRFVGQILRTRPSTKHHLVLVLGYNIGGQNPTQDQIDNLSNQLKSVLSNKELSSKIKNLKIILQAYRWDGIKYPFGLMQQYILKNDPKLHRNIHKPIR